MNALQALAAVLEKENALLLELIALSEEKQKHINDAQEVSRIASEEQQLLTQLEKVEQERAVLYDVVASGKRVEEWIAQLTLEQQELFDPLITDLAQNVAQLQSLNNLNHQLLEESLAFVQFTLNMLTHDPAPTHARTGTSSQGKSIFDRKV